MRLEGEPGLCSMRSPRPDGRNTPRPGAPGVVPCTNLLDVNAYLLQRCVQARSVYITENPFLSRVDKSERAEASVTFVDALCKLERLETLSLQRSFITDGCLIHLCERWRHGAFPYLSQLNLNQNLISDAGFIALAGCLVDLRPIADNLKIWALNQLRPSTLATHQCLVDAIERNPRVTCFEINWRSEELLSRVKDIINKRRINYAESVQDLKSALVEIQSHSPHLKVFRLADNEALRQIWSKDVGDPDLSGTAEPNLPNTVHVMSALGLLAKNHHLITLELPGNGLRTDFVEFFFDAVVQGGSFRSVRHLNLERNCFNVSDIETIISLLDVHYAFEEEMNPCALMPFESLRLESQQELKGTKLIEMKRESILDKFIWNLSLNDLTIDVSDEIMRELKIYLQRNEKKHRSLVAIASVNQQVSSPLSATIRRQSTAVMRDASLKIDKQSPKSPKARFLFSPKSPVEDRIYSVDTVDDVMAMVARESPTIEDFTLSNSRFLSCLNESNELRFSRALVNLLAYNFQLHTIALTNCGIRDPFLLALIDAKSNGDFRNLIVLDFNRNSLSDSIIISLLQSPVFELKVIRLRHRSTICSPRMGEKVLNLLNKYHRKRLRIFEFDFDNAALQKQAEQMLAKSAREEIFNLTMY